MDFDAMEQRDRRQSDFEQAIDRHQTASPDEYPTECIECGGALTDDDAGEHDRCFNCRTSEDDPREDR